MLRDKVGAWLNSQNDATDVKPVMLMLNGKRYQGAYYRLQGEQRLYVIGKRPDQKGPTCYRIHLLEESTVDDDQRDWYIAGSIQNESNFDSVDWENHPFGNHWVVVPWDIEDDPDSRIDDYSDEEYCRQYIDVEVSR